MAKNPPPGDNHRKGAVTGRSQTYNPKTDSILDNGDATENGHLVPGTRFGIRQGRSGSRCLSQ